MATPREIIRTLLAKQIPERVGLNESFWPYLFENTWSAQGWKVGTDPVSEFGLDIRNVGWLIAPAPRPDLCATLEETDEWRVTRDGWGAVFKNWKKKSGTPEHIAFAVTAESWKRDFREAALAIDVRKHLDIPALRQQYQAAMATDRFITFAGLMIFEELRRILGDVVMLESMASEREFINDFTDVITRKHIEMWDIMLREVGLPDGIHVYEDLGYTQSAFCSVRMHNALVKPCHQRLIGFFKSHKLPVIFHTCGDFRIHIPALVEAGADCIQALEGKTGMDVVELAKQWKDKLCFMGNLDIRAFESGDRNRIREECLGKLNGMKAQRAPFIFMSDHSIPPTVTLADYRYALELYRANCRY
jgi:uroporphyrinogen decarboxylase